MKFVIFILSGLLSFSPTCEGTESLEFSPFSIIPSEIKTKFFWPLNLSELQTVSLVCHEFNDLVKDIHNMKPLCLYDDIIHPKHAFFHQSPAFTYYQVFSAHHHWTLRQQVKDEIDPLFYKNLELGSEYALNVFYPVFAHYFMGLMLHSEKATQRWENLVVNHLQHLDFYANQGSHKAQDNLILSYLLLFLFVHDESSSWTTTLSIPPLIPLMKKYAESGNSFMQVLLCDFYLDTSMACDHPSFQISSPYLIASMKDMNRAFLPGRLHNMVVPDQKKSLRTDVGLRYGITYAIRGNHFLQEQMFKIFFQGKYGFEIDETNGYFLLDKLLAKSNAVYITPLLKVLPTNLNRKYRSFIHEKLIQEADQGHEMAQRTLIKCLAYGIYAIKKSPMDAEKYGRKFKLPPRIKKIKIGPILFHPET